jgi:hypothetical protein
MPTPRGQFKRFLSRRIISDLFGDEEHGKAFATYREWVDDRIQLARKLAAVLGAEKEPYIVCGDFNTPDHGYIHASSPRFGRCTRYRGTRLGP